VALSWTVESNAYLWETKPELYEEQIHVSKHADRPSEDRVHLISGMELNTHSLSEAQTATPVIVPTDISTGLKPKKVNISYLGAPHPLRDAMQVMT